MANKQYRLCVCDEYDEYDDNSTMLYRFLYFNFGTQFLTSYPTEEEINKILDTYNAIDDPCTYDLIFESEEDMLVFKLKYG